MSGGGSGREENYWPGFVDALSSVVLALVFVLVIFVFALVMASSKVEKKIQEIKQTKAEDKKIELAQKQEIQELQKQLETAAEEIELLKKVIPKSGNPLDEQSDQQLDNDNLNVTQQPSTQSYIGSASMVEKQNMITLNFPDSVANIDEKSSGELEKAFNGIKNNIKDRKIILRSIIGNESYSVARRMAYYRAIDVRNFLISKAGESPSIISSVIVQPEKPEKGRVEIIIKKSQ
jgi:hypothetical protein